MGLPLPKDKTSQGWPADLELEFDLRNRRTVLTRNRHTGPLRVQRLLYPENRVCHAYILHPPGGVVGGDRLNTRATVKTGAAALVTTPGATKFYRAGGRKAAQAQHFLVEKNGSLEWFPQETILYPGAETGITTRIELEKDAGFMGWDILCIGLPACQGKFDAGFLEASMEITRQGRPIFKDRLRVSGPADLDRPTGMRGFSVCATFMAVGVDPKMENPLREKLDPAAGVIVGITRMEDLLVARYLGDSSWTAKKLFEKIWAWLRPRLAGRTACPPGIWST